MHDTNQRVLEAIEQLNYDFRQFTVEHFLKHLMGLRQRAIVLEEFSFGAEIHAAWISLGRVDYILYNAATHRVHQIHNILHECGHIVLNHTGQNLKSLVSPALLGSAHELADSVRGRLRMVQPENGPQEREAEAFVRLLQREILVANRLEQLTGRASSIEELARFAKNLGYHD